MSICKKEIFGILKNAGIEDRKDIIYLLYLLKDKKYADENDNFFWDVLTNDDVEKYVLKQVKSYDE